MSADCPHRIILPEAGETNVQIIHEGEKTTAVGTCPDCGEKFNAEGHLKALRKAK